MRVLIVEDERKIATAVQEGLRAEQYDVAVEQTGEGAFFRACTEPFDLILLDLALPGRSGIEVLTAIRQRSLVPIIVLTAHDTVQDRVRGLDLGADDYLVKPFAFAELLARIRSLVRRHRAAEPCPIAVGSLSLDPATRRATRAGQPLELTSREFDLLEHLMRAEGQVVSREAIAREVWKEAARTGPLDNVIDVHMVRLRRKLDAVGLLQAIHTIRGVGFLLSEGDVGDAADSR